MDRDRFRTCASDLVKLSDQLLKLSGMPDRATRHDFEAAATLVSRAAKDLEDLLKVQLPGCICRRIQDDYYNYLEYAEACQHHGGLFHQHAATRAHYEKLENALKDEVRMRFITAALTGTASDQSTNKHIVQNALDLADEALRRLVDKAGT